MPLISVIVPVYKAEPYIEACVGSILSQTFSDFELILVNDGSPDRSGELCDKLAKTDPRIQVIHKENGGAATARNGGLDAAQGDYIAFVDSDDLIHPQYLEFLLQLLQTNNADFAMCHYDFFKDESTIFSGTPTEDGAILRGPELLAEFHKHCRRVSLISLCMKLFKKEIFDGLRIPEGQTAEDSLVLPMILERANIIVRSDQKLYYWRETPGSVTRGGVNANYLHRINISDSYACFFAKRGDKTLADHFRAEYLQRTVAHYFNICHVKPELLPAFQPYMKKYRQRFWDCFRARGLSPRARVAFVLFLIRPKWAEKPFARVYGRGVL